MAPRGWRQTDTPPNSIQNGGRRVCANIGIELSRRALGNATGLTVITDLDFFKAETRSGITQSIEK